MKIAIGNDHRGVELKQKIISRFKNNIFMDIGSSSKEGSVDYPDYAARVTKEIINKKCERGILICGSGIGMSMSANKFPGIRAAMVWDPKIAELTRQHNDSNVLCLASDFTETATIFDIVDVWLKTPFEGGRHQRRVEKMNEQEASWNISEKQTQKSRQPSRKN